MGFLLFLTLLFFARLLIRPGEIIYSPQSDIIFQYLHMKKFPFECLRDYGGISLWNPYLMSGTPFLGNPQSSLFYPPNALFFFLPAEPLIGWMIAAHLAWAAIGIFFLGKRFGAGNFGSTISAVAFAFGATMVGHIWAGHFTHLLGVAWIPWVILAFEKMKEKPFYALWLALSLSLMYFTGHIQEWFYLSFILLAFALAHWIFLWKKEGFRRGVKWISLMCITALLVLAVVAIDFLPCVEVARLGLRSGGLSFKEACAFSLPPGQLIGLLNPNAWGAITKGGSLGYFGPVNYWEYTTYVGILPLLLAILGMIKGVRGRVHLLLLGLCSLLFALGRFFPLFWIFYKFVPGFNLFRVPARSLFFFVMVLALFAGVGAKSLMSQASRIRVETKWIAIGFLLVVLAGLVITASLRSAFPPRNYSKAPLGEAIRRGKISSGEIAAEVTRRTFFAPLFLLFSLSGATLLLIRARGKVGSRPFGAAALALVVADLWAYGLPMIKTAPLKKAFPENEAIRFLKEKALEGRIWDEAGWLQDALTMRHRLESIGGYEATILRHYADFVEAMTGRKATLEVFPTWYLTRRELEKDVRDSLVDLLNVRYIVTGKILRKPRWEEVYRRVIIDGRRAYRILIYKNLTALPRAFVVHRGSFVSSEEEALRRLRELPVREEVLLGPHNTSGATLIQEEAVDKEEKAQVQKVSPDRLGVKVNLESSGYLVISETWMPGWKARVDGKKTPVLQGDLAFLAIPLDAGSHDVELYYWPDAFTAGIFITLATLISLAVFLLAGLLTRRKSPGR